MQAQVPGSLYWPDSQDSVIARMRGGIMPDPFIRRMRLINLISAVVLRKIEPELLAPFDVEDLHHILDKQISQDAVIDQLDNKMLAGALFSGNLNDLWTIAEANPLLLKGFVSGWLQKFFNEPFNPLCIMLAMRSKLLLDAIDEMGHSYNLLRAIGFGWIDFGEIPGEEPGDPGNYYPPQIDNPIVTPPAGGGPGPGEPGYVTPGPGQPGYVPGGPGPGEPGYVPPGPGQPGYAPPGPGPGEPGYTPPIPAPTGPGAGYGGGGIGGSSGSMTAPSGYLDQGLWTGPPSYSGGFGGGLDCCRDKDNPSLFVHIGYDTLEMNCGDIQGLTIEGFNPLCDASNYTWDITQGTGTLDTSEDYGAIYTAPAGGPECESPTIINLYCAGGLVDTILIVINSCPATASIDHTTLQMDVDDEHTLNVVPGTPGCGAPVYAWAITAGGGSLSASSGESVVYTAPHTNPNCAENPTITLSCNGAELDTLKIAINGYPTPVFAYSRCCDFTQGAYHQSCMRKFRCDGTPYDTDTYPDCEAVFCGFDSMFYNNVCLHPGYYDARLQAWKDAGCCPEQFII